MTRMIVALAAAVLTGWLSGAAAAQPKAAESAIAIIDTQALLEKAAAAKSARQQIETLRAGMAQSVSAQQQELRQQSQSLAKDRATLGEDVFQQRMRDLMQKNTDVQRSTHELQVKLDGASRAAAKKIEVVVGEIVDELKKEHRYSLVVLRSATMGTPGVPDITEDVLGRLDRRMPTVEVTLQ
jgi:Skp family chaperone for outer membrane proteins